MKILANDGISNSGEKVLKEAGLNLLDNRVSQEHLIPFINENQVEVLLVKNATQVTKELIDACPSLKIIGKGGESMDNIEVEYAKSKGIYVINRKFLKRYLEDDAKDTVSSHDFGKNIIPKMLNNDAKMYAYAFNGYWKDVGTVDSFWEANMDLLKEKPELDLHDRSWKIYSVNPAMPPHYVGENAKVVRSLVSEGAIIKGEVVNSVVFSGVTIEEGAKVVDSVIMPNAHIGSNAEITRVVVSQDCELMSEAKVGCSDGEIVVVPEGEIVYATVKKDQVV